MERWAPAFAKMPPIVAVSGVGVGPIKLITVSLLHVGVGLDAHETVRRAEAVLSAWVYATIPLFAAANMVTVAPQMNIANLLHAGVDRNARAMACRAAGVSLAQAFATTLHYVAVNMVSVTTPQSTVIQTLVTAVLIIPAPEMMLLSSVSLPRLLPLWCPRLFPLRCPRLFPPCRQMKIVCPTRR